MLNVILKLSVTAVAFLSYFNTNPAFATERTAQCGGGTLVPISDGKKRFVEWRKSSGEVEIVYEGTNTLSAISQCNGGVVSVFRSGIFPGNFDWAYFSPDCRFVGGGGGKTVHAYQENNHNIQGLFPHESGTGIVAGWQHIDGGKTGWYYSPNCLNIGGDGNTVGLNEMPAYGRELD